MIKIPKKQLFNGSTTSFDKLRTSPERSRGTLTINPERSRRIKTKPLRIIIYIVLNSVLYILLPVYLTAHLKALAPRALPVFYLTNILIVFYSLKKNSQEKHHLRLCVQDLQEKINILNDQNAQELKNKLALKEKISRYNNLKIIIEEINESLTLESIADRLSEFAFSLIANNKGACALYLVDKHTQVNLNLFKTKKEDKKLVIKAKEGDIFDFWVLRHAQALLVEDAKRDFRFDLEKLEAQGERAISSLISSPLISSKKFLGILRLDNRLPSFYSQDDLRFLMTICDLGAIALENGDFFQETQDLAIHDGLTSLFTKGYFLERLKEEYKRSVRKGSPLSLLMLDIDYFKNYNDKYGHTAGDIVLKSLSQVTVEFFKGLSSVISRFGGEEFCIILPDIDKKKAFVLAGQLRAKIEEAEIILRRQKTKISVSIGVAAFPSDARDEDELILKADRAMYEAKQRGRNKVVNA